MPNTFENVRVTMTFGFSIAIGIAVA